MNSPRYAIIQAADKGRNAGYDFAAARKRYPLACEPKNPYAGDLNDPCAIEWETAFRSAIKRFQEVHL